jgi:hypothetical protein
MLGGVGLDKAAGGFAPRGWLVTSSSATNAILVRPPRHPMLALVLGLAMIPLRRIGFHIP